jgi:hypothetical protein
MATGHAARVSRLVSHRRRLGAYGLRLAGAEAAAALFVDAPEAWPAFRLRARLGTAAPGGEHVDEGRARLLLRSGGEIAIDREAGDVLFTVPEEVGPQALVHPYLAPAAAVIARWLGRESFHGGAFVAGDRVWGVLGERESGKSSILAWLALRGQEVVCDDMLIVDGTTVFAGPRSVDLRRETAELLGAGEPLGVVGARERWRVSLPQIAPELTLGGWAFLEWGETVDVRPVDPSERLARLLHHRGVRLPPASHETLLSLAALPAFELVRPRSWDSVTDAGERLLGAVAVD